MTAEKAKGLLTEEKTFFKEMLGDWLSEHQGEYALIHGRTLLGFFKTAEEAVRNAGGEKEYFVGLVAPEEKSHYLRHQPAEVSAAVGI